jgi:hypothetical protein
VRANPVKGLLAQCTHKGIKVKPPVWREAKEEEKRRGNVEEREKKINKRNYFRIINFIKSDQDRRMKNKNWNLLKRIKILGINELNVLKRIKKNKNWNLLKRIKILGINGFKVFKKINKNWNFFKRIKILGINGYLVING